jgi:hypothetical protein
MEIQTLKPGKCSLTLDASRIIQGTQQTDILPDATTTFSQQLALSADEAWEKLSASTPGDITNFQIPAEPPLNDAPTQHEAARSIGAHNTNKRLECRSLAFLGQAEDPEAGTETRLPDL